MTSINILTSILLSLAVQAQPLKGYEINGYIKGLKEGEKINMNIYHGKWFKEFIDWNRQDSAYVKNGAFHISGIVPEDGPRLYYLEFDKHPRNVCRMLIDNNQKITISSDMDIDSIPHDYLDHSLKIEGSPSNEAWHTLNMISFPFLQTVLTLNGRLRKIKDSVGFDRSLIGGVILAREDVFSNIYGNFFKNRDLQVEPAAPITIDGNGWFERTNHAAFWKSLYDSWDDKTKDSYYGKKIKDNLILCVGQPFPLFTLPASNGKMLAIKDVIAKSKLTLVEFYASNSYHVDEFQRELQVNYKKYHPKGLNMVGVSSDTSMKKWKIAASDLPWDQVSDLQGENGVVNKTYKEYGDHNTSTPNTTNVLIDPNGKIVAWDVYGIELQWYLSKYLENGNDSVSAK